MLTIVASILSTMTLPTTLDLLDPDFDLEADLEKRFLEELNRRRLRKEDFILNGYAAES